MKFSQLLSVVFTLLFSGSVVAQSVEILKPADGDMVDIDSFMVHVNFEGFQEIINEEHHDAYIQLDLIADEIIMFANLGAFCQPSASFNFHNWGRSVKFVQPDMYLNSFCDFEEDELRIVYRAKNFAEQWYLEPGDSIDLRIRAWSHVPPTYIEDKITVTLE
jgi:hypothetical protein